MENGSSAGRRRRVGMHAVKMMVHGSCLGVVSMTTSETGLRWLRGGVRMYRQSLRRMPTQMRMRRWSRECSLAVPAHPLVFVRQNDHVNHHGRPCAHLSSLCGQPTVGGRMCGNMSHAAVWKTTRSRGRVSQRISVDSGPAHARTRGRRSCDSCCGSRSSSRAAVGSAVVATPGRWVVPSNRAGPMPMALGEQPCICLSTMSAKI
jgi:hypothetical protein